MRAQVGPAGSALVVLPHCSHLAGGKMNRTEDAGAGVLPQRGRRHPLLYQQRFNEMVFWPTILIVALSAVLIVWGEPGFRGYLGAALAASGAILVFTLIFRLRSYVQCRFSELCIQLPFLRLVIPYRSIRSTRPTDLYRLFFPDDQRWTQRRFLDPLFGRTVVVVDLDDLPVSRRSLRLWMSRYMLAPDTEGLVLVVRDWIELRSELDEFKARNHYTTLSNR